MNEGQELNFPPISPDTHHTCNSRREGDWIIFTCPDCPEYCRRYNWKTGKMIISGDNWEIKHQGSYFPTGINPAISTPN